MDRWEGEGGLPGNSPCLLRNVLRNPSCFLSSYLRPEKEDPFSRGSWHRAAGSPDGQADTVLGAGPWQAGQ